MEELLRFLCEHNIAFERHDHPAVYTVEEAGRLVPSLAAAKTKNLFLRDKKGARHFLVVVPAEKRINIKDLNDRIGSSRLSFGSAERLKKYLGVDPGAVTILGIFNDPDHAVEVILDRDLWHETAFQCHPLVNTCTLVIAKDGLEQFLDLMGHDVKIVDVPGLD